MSDGRAGIVGVGNMGGRVARRILDGGHALIAYDAAPEQLERFGVSGAPSLVELVRETEIVLFSLPDSRVIESVVFGDEGVLAACTPGQVVVDLSTASPRSTVRVSRAFLEQGVDFLDAGVSGGAAAAEAGSLTLIVGGSEQALERVRDLLACFATRVYHMGSSGSGHTAKLLNNFLNGVGLAATAEVMVAARKAGLDLRLLLEVLNHSSGVNFATLNRFPRIVEGDYLEGGMTGNLMLKDLRLYRDLVETLGVRTLNAQGCIATFELAAELGYGEQISNRVVDALGDVSGGVRVSDTHATAVNESEGAR